MDHFSYGSEEYRRELQNDPHHSGEVRFLRSIARPGMRVMEIGANSGVTAIALAKAIGDAGHLYAFEPVPEYYNTLKENLLRNEIKNVSVYRLALSDQTGRIRFYKRGGGSGITAAEGGEMLWVEASTVTEFLAIQEFGRVNLLNMDCEGSELLVLHGAKAVLKDQAPEIFCEIHHDYLKELAHSVDDVIGYLRQFGYHVRPLQVENSDMETSLDKCSHVYAAVPSVRT